jgi:NAD(P)H-dependent FMN reductase
MKILGISGSLRQGSYNSALLRAAVELAPAGVAIEVGTIKGIPLYDGDVEAAGYPEAAAKLKAQFIAADAVLLVTPEYNNGIPGVFKNAIDWLSRPPAEAGKVFGGKPVGVIGASPGGFGTILSQDAWLPVLRTLGCNTWAGGRLMVSRAHTLMSPAGELADEKTRTLLKTYLTGFADFARA